MPLSEADGVRWVREPAMGRRAEVRHTRLGSIWGLGVCQGQRQRIFGVQRRGTPPSPTRTGDQVVRSDEKEVGTTGVRAWC